MSNFSTFYTHNDRVFPGIPYRNNGDLTSGGDITTLDTSSSQKLRECGSPAVVSDTAVFKNFRPLANGDNR